MLHDDPCAALHDLILEGEALQDANRKELSEAAFTMWVERVCATLAGDFGRDHPFVVQTEEAGHPAHTWRDRKGLPPSYFRVRTMIVLKVWRRAAFELQVRASGQRALQRSAASAGTL